MELYSERLIYRPVQQHDLADLFRIFGDPATNMFNPAGPYPDLAYTEGVLQRWLRQWQTDGFGCWAISLHGDPQHVVGFGGINKCSVEPVNINNLGFRFENDVWGQGLATELSCFAIRHGFMTLALPEISALVRCNHLASQRVLRKSGLRYSQQIDDIPDHPPSLLFTLTRDRWLNDLYPEREAQRVNRA